MKKSFLTLCFLLLASCVLAQPSKLLLPGKGHIDVEQLNKNIDLQMDISQLSVSELRVLRNAISARQGYLFMDADLRGIYQMTSWYTELMFTRYESEYDEERLREAGLGPIAYTPEEKAFMEKLERRENELLRKNFVAAEGKVVNMDNLVNPYQLEKAEPALMEALGKHGFAIVPDNEVQLFQVYERNDYHDFPNFVTTDLYLQAFHFYFDTVLKETEQHHLIPLLDKLTTRLYQLMTQRAASAGSKQEREAAKWNAAYFAVARSLLTAEALPKLPDNYGHLAEQELKNVDAARTCTSRFLEREDVPFVYDIYRPRGHYTRTDDLQRYFKAMMWLQNVPFGTDSPQFLRRAALMAETIGADEALSQQFQAIMDPITFLLGQPDNVTIMQLYDLMVNSRADAAALCTDDALLQELRLKVDALAARQTRIVPKFQLTSQVKLNLFPQRYMPDSEVLQEMVDNESPVTRRAVPSGLDVLAAMGVGAAERILLDEMQEAQRWDKYAGNLDRMKQRMRQVDWQQTSANRWLESLTHLTDQSDNMPYFMRSEQWDKKALNTALASWAELKHDAILYAKQPMGAECGDGAPPEPIVRGYVEPNVAYWRKAISLIEATTTLLEKYGFMNEKLASASEDLRDKAEFLLEVSKKELKNIPLSEEEYGQIEYIGSSFEYITLNLISEPDEAIMGWDNVQGADKSISVVADIYTANSENNPEKSVLYSAVGPAHEIYVVVEMEGYLYLTRGAVFSYREFQEDISAPRKTDEEWQMELRSTPDKGIPEWMKEIIVPINGRVVDNEHIFYSTGC